VVRKDIPENKIAEEQPERNKGANHIGRAVEAEITVDDNVRSKLGTF
jgi:hypothetical protein